MIIGLTGRNGSGKGAIAEILQSKGFGFYSLSDVIRMEIRREGFDVTRERMIAKGRELREKGGPSCLARLILKELHPGKNWVVDSIRNPAEVETLREREDFTLLAVEADVQTRFERCRNRGREGDPKILEEFIRLENEELNSTNPAGQQLVKTAALADVIVKNDGDLRELQAQVERILAQRGFKG